MTTTPRNDKVFAGSIPKLYEQYMVPMIFEPYAVDLIKRVTARSPSRVLEIACGTGVVTRLLAAALPADTVIVATDLNQAMIEQARETGTRRAVEWRQADALQLPFADGEFDVVVCQFGAMFFPDKAKAFSEAHRVLRPGGAFMFNVWDRIEENDFAAAIQQALTAIFPDDPPRFMERTPHGYCDFDAISRHLKEAGFGSPPEIETVAARSKVPNAGHPAIAYCQGTPWRGEIEERGPGRLGEITGTVEKALAGQFGQGPLDGKIQAHVITVERTN